MKIAHKQAAHLLAFFSLIVFVVTPGFFYLFNRTQWGYDYWLVLIFAILGVLSFISLFGIYCLINKISNKLAYIFVYTFFTLGLVTLLNDVFSPLQLGPLDGRRLYSEEPLFFTLLELTISCLVVFFVFFSLRKNKKWIYEITRAAYIMGAGLIIFAFALQSIYLNKGSLAVASKNQYSTKQLPNIYHIHVEGLQTDYFLRYMHNRPKAKKELMGFTIFEKNISNYPTTLQSQASYLTSTTHLSGRFDKWLRKYDQGLLSNLKKTGYQLTQHSLRPLDSAVFDSTIDLKKALDYQGALIVEFTRVWLAKVSPNFLTNEVLPIGKKLGSKFFNILNPKSSIGTRLTKQDGSSAYYGIYGFNDLTSRISEHPPTNQYIYSINDILHDAYKVSPACEFENKPDFSLGERYFRQFECTMRLIDGFVTELKNLNRFSNSIIIIHGDHGSHYAGQLLNTKGTSFSTNKDSISQPPYDLSIGSSRLVDLESQARALLMIKPLNALGEMKISDTPSQLLDIYPTIMGQVGIKNLKEVEGIDIFNDTVTFNKPRYFYYMYASAYATQVSNVHAMTPQYDKKSGVLRLVTENIGKTTAQSFFESSEDVKKYKDIDFFYKVQNSKVITDVGWVFLDGIGDFNDWGAWTIKDNATIAFVPKNANTDEYKTLSLKIMGAFVNDKNQQLSADLYLNKTLIGSLEFNMSKSEHSFPETFDFRLPKNLVINGKPNIFEIKMLGANSEKNLGISADARKLGLALVRLSLDENNFSTIKSFKNFYPWEGSPGDFRWAKKNPKIVFQNLGSENILERLAFRMGSLNYRKVDIALNGIIIDSFVLDQIEHTVDLMLNLIPGENIVEIISNEPAVNPPGLDDRLLLLSIKDVYPFI
ncbi:hypothetical protein OAB52_01915 [Candidatus Thioglobus sp.]|nr:hypothetical protein [Candidatus Thioglobus sp.]